MQGEVGSLGHVVLSVLGVIHSSMICCCLVVMVFVGSVRGWGGGIRLMRAPPFRCCCSISCSTSIRVCACVVCVWVVCLSVCVFEANCHVSTHFPPKEQQVPHPPHPHISNTKQVLGVKSRVLFTSGWVLSKGSTGIEEVGGRRP